LLRAQSATKTIALLFGWHMRTDKVFILPGWKGSGPGHWQSRWERLYGYIRVEQHDWIRPLRGDWVARLEEVLLEGNAPSVLVAHSLGCIHVAAWAAHSRNTHLVNAVLLAAPPDVERDDIRQMIPGWAPVPMQKLPFRSVLLASDDDPFCSEARSRAFAAYWGAEYVEVKHRGHLNADSRLGDWPEVHAQLQRLRAGI
jgi:predicted alpha/beta hydrolase family esterase